MPGDARTVLLMIQRHNETGATRVIPRTILLGHHRDETKTTDVGDWGQVNNIILLWFNSYDERFPIRRRRL
jgi:hypothetical protein